MADAHYGIFRVNVANGTKESLVLPDEIVDGRNNRLFNSIAVAMNGDVYYSVSSTRFANNSKRLLVFIFSTVVLILFLQVLSA